MRRYVMMLAMACHIGCGGVDSDDKDRSGLSQPTSGQLSHDETSSNAMHRAKDVSNSIGMKLRLIKAGTFLMGPDDEPAPDEEKSHRSTQVAADFYLGVTEVTQEQWTAIMETKPWSKDSFVNHGKKHPAVFVSWDDVAEFCKRLSEKEGVRYRLPTEQEWEYACRAGTTTKFSFGDDVKNLGEYAWFGHAGLHEVGLKRPNAWGLHDMHGNVWEFCRRPGDDQSKTKVIRGGSWGTKAGKCRAGYRGRSSWTRGNDIGFRVARDL